MSNLYSYVGGLRLVLLLDHPQCYHARQYIGHEGGSYQQQRDEQPFEGSDTTQQHTGIEHRYDHHQRLSQIPYLMKHILAQRFWLLLVALVSHHGLHERSRHTGHQHRID